MNELHLLIFHKVHDGFPKSAFIRVSRCRPLFVLSGNLRKLAKEQVVVGHLGALDRDNCLVTGAVQHETRRDNVQLIKANWQQVPFSQARRSGCAEPVYLVMQ